jgi:hypothetical protein
LLTPLQTPPPNYDLVVGTPSVDGLADYFARRQAYESTHNMSGAADGDGDGSGSSDAVRIPDSDNDSDTNTIGPEDTTATPPAAGQGQEGTAPSQEVDPFNTLNLVQQEQQQPSVGAATEEEEHAVPADDDDADDEEEDSSASDSAEEDEARAHRKGRVNVANPRTPGGRLVPSRSLEIERPAVRLDMSEVLRRRHAA